MRLEEHISEAFIPVLLKNGTKKEWKESEQLIDIDQKYYCSRYNNMIVNKYGVKCGTSLRFWENKSWVNEIDPYG